MRIEPLIIALVLFSGVVLGMGAFYDGVGEGYNVTTEDIAQYSQAEYGRSYSNEIQDEAGELETKPTDFVFLIRMPYVIAKSFVSSIGHFTEATTSITEMEELGLPMWVGATIITIIGIVVTMALLRAIWEKRL